jgi:hypothetical protein
MRATRRQAAKALRGGARGYIKARARVQAVADATGRPGKMAAIATVLTVQAAKDAADRWWELVADVEREEKRKAAPQTPEPPTTIADYIGTPAPADPGVR